MAARKVAVPHSVNSLRAAVKQFRSEGSRRAKLPESLWQAVVEQARQDGVKVGAHTVRLDYNALIEGADGPKLEKWQKR